MLASGAAACELRSCGSRGCHSATWNLPGPGIEPMSLHGPASSYPPMPLDGFSGFSENSPPGDSFYDNVPIYFLITRMLSLVEPTGCHNSDLIKKPFAHRRFKMCLVSQELNTKVLTTQQ